MNLLLDTHIWLWSLLEPAHLTERVRNELENPSNDLWFSPIMVWEFLILVEKGRVILDLDPSDWIRNVFRKIPMKEAPISTEVAIRSRSVGLPHQDPVDRFLAATAVVYDLTLVTADTRLLNSEEFTVLANR